MDRQLLAQQIRAITQEYIKVSKELIEKEEELEELSLQLLEKRVYNDDYWKYISMLSELSSKVKKLKMTLRLTSGEIEHKKEDIAKKH